MAATASSSTDVTQPKSATIQFINSQKGKSLPVADEYTFKLNKTTATTKYCKCTLNTCSVKIHTDLNGQLIKMSCDHSHLPEKEKN